MLECPHGAQGSEGDTDHCVKERNAAVFTQRRGKYVTDDEAV